jgi:hypothetical protein
MNIGEERCNETPPYVLLCLAHNRFIVVRLDNHSQQLARRYRLFPPHFNSLIEEMNEREIMAHEVIDSTLW